MGQAFEASVISIAQPAVLYVAVCSSGRDSPLLLAVQTEFIQRFYSAEAEILIYTAEKEFQGKTI